MIGKVAKCSKGRIGIITDKKELPWGESWVGIGFDGELWASRNPEIIANCVNSLMPIDLLKALFQFHNPIDDIDLDKIEFKCREKFGLPVKIIWSKEFDDVEDHGYLLAIPGYGDIDLEAVVHIPDPENPGGKDSCPPEWHALTNLTNNKYVDKIIIG